MPRETKPLPPPENYAPLGYRIFVATGPECGSQVLLDRPLIRIGAHETSDLVLSDSFASKNHCEIVLEKGAHVLRDLKSRNGTFVNGLQVAEVKLIPGAMIRIGTTDLIYQVNDVLDRLEISPSNQFGEYLSHSTTLRRMFTLLGRAAPTHINILITGETGTGKDVLARSIHAKSSVSNGPFIVVDCGAVAENLIESELFGHERGAFTGANQMHRGAFERAHGGTIFLDEIGELNLDLQPKLLRVLEQREFQRVGGQERMPVNVRIIAATNRDLQTEVKNKKFRQDLFYRLSVLNVHLPPLKKRIEDLPVLVTQFIKGHERIKSVSAEALSLLMNHPWPGNIRELRNVIQRALAFAPGPQLLPQDIQFETIQRENKDSGPMKPHGEYSQSPKTLEEKEREHILQTLKDCRWNKSEAARRLQIASSTLYAKMKKLGIDDPTV